jgi:hypothetical protein
MLHPVVLETYLAGAVPPIPPQPADPKRERPSGALRKEELAVLEFIQSRLK